MKSKFLTGKIFSRCYGKKKIYWQQDQIFFNMLYLMALVIAAPVIILAVLPCKWRWYIKLAAGTAVLLIALKMMILRLIGGPLFFAPDLPGWLLTVSSFLYCTEVLFLIALLLHSTVRTVIRILLRFQPSARLDKCLKFRQKINTVLLIAAAFTAAWGMFNARSVPAVKNIIIRNPHLPANADNCTIAVLADLHIDAVTNQATLQKIIERTNALQADLIVIAGDMVDGTIEQRGQLAGLLQKLHAPLGVYAVSGNHDCYSGYEDWMKFFADNHIVMLENKFIRLPNDIVLVGISDPAIRKTGRQVPEVNTVLGDTARNSYTILLAHRPNGAAANARHGVDLQISGHTHGGMIRGFDLLVGKFNENFISGLYRVGDMDLYVSNGSAIWSGFPIRLGRNSEITLITLQRGTINSRL